MKKRMKWFLISTSGVMAVLLVVAIYIYFRVDDSLEIQEDVNLFKNDPAILRLDHARLTSDSLTAFITALMKKAHVHGLAGSIFNPNKLIYQTFFRLNNNRTSDPLLPGTLFHRASLSQTGFSHMYIQLQQAK